MEWEVLEKRNRLKVTHTTPLMGGRLSKQCFLWSGSQLSTRDQHQHIMSNTDGKDRGNDDDDDDDENDEGKNDDGHLVFPGNTSTLE